jgi:hypothetical protein
MSIAPLRGADAIQHRPGPLGRAEGLCAFGADDWGRHFPVIISTNDEQGKARIKKRWITR